MFFLDEVHDTVHKAIGGVYAVEIDKSVVVSQTGETCGLVVPSSSPYMITFTIRFDSNVVFSDVQFG